MKRLKFMFFVFGAALLFFSCADNNPIAPEQNQNDQAAALEKGKCRTTFTGTSKFVQPIDPGTTTTLPNGMTFIKGMIVEWQEEASDQRVSGQSIWKANQIIKEDGSVKYWGTAEINVGVNDDDNPLEGKWKMWWHGKISDGIGIAKAYAIGTEGDVQGLFAKSTYTIDLTVGPPPTAFYVTEGFIRERRR